MSDHRKKFSFENLNLKLNEFSNIYDNSNMKNISQFLEKNPEFVNHREEKSGCTLLTNAVLNGNYELVQYLLEQKFADPNVQNDNGMTALHLAVESGNHKIINILLERGANPNIPQQHGDTPLHMAANKGEYKVIKLLCLFGADINIRTLNDLSVFDYAMEKGNQKCIDVVKSLIEKQKFENNQNTIIDNKYNIYHYPDEIVSDVPTGFKTTKNSDSPINRIKENMNIPFYTPDFVYKDFNFQNFTAKNSRSPYMNYKGFSSNTNNPSAYKIHKNPMAQYSFENTQNINQQESQYERGISFYPDYNSAESKRYLDEYDSVNNKKKNYFSDKYSLRESSSFFIQMNDFEQRLEKIKKDLLENVAVAYENNIDGESQQIPTTTIKNANDNLEDKVKDEEILVLPENDKKDKDNKISDENYFSLATPNYKLDISEVVDENNNENHRDNQEENNENTNNINIENLNTPYLNTYSSNSKYNNSYSNLAQRLTFNNVERRQMVRSDNYVKTLKSENERIDQVRTPSHKQEPINYMTFINTFENTAVNQKNLDMPRRFILKDGSQPISPIVRTLDENRYPSSTSLRQINRPKEEKNFVLNMDEIQAITLQPNYIESENNLSKHLNYNRVDTHHSNAENYVNVNFNDNSENNVYDYYHDVPALKHNMSNNLFSLSNTKTNEYLISDLELTNEITKIKKLLSENFYDDGRVLTVFYSNKNDIDENYVKKRIIKEESPNVVKSRTQKNNLGEFSQTRRKIEELLNFNIQEFEEYLKSSILKDEEEEHEEDLPSTKQSPKVQSPKKNINQIKTKEEKEEDLRQSINSLYSQPVNKDNYDRFSSVAVLQQTHSVKYLSKTNRSLKDKDEYKHMSMDTYTIDEVSVTICPRSINDTLDKMNMITADIKQNGIDQIEFEYNSTEAMKEVDSFLKTLELEKYTATFLKNGFDDLQMIIDQMKSETAITDKNLKDIGIILPGHRAKILLKLEEKAGSFEFPLPSSVYHTVDPSFIKLEDIISDQYMYSIDSWLTGLKMERYTLNFFNCGYHSIELLFLQMNSKNPLTEKMLEEEIKIKKIGYRIRLLKKLRDDGKEYFNKLKNLYSVKLLDQKNPSSLDSCKCFIF